LTGPISKSKTSVIFINQTREKIGVFYGKKETTPGGKALKFYASVRIEIKKGEKIVDSEGTQIGNWLKAVMVKNKVGYPWRSAEFELYYNRGIDLVGAALDYGVDKEIIKKSGNTHLFNDKKMGVSRDQAKKYLEEHSDVYSELLKEIKHLTK
jgi:recombination protein RecA